MYEEVGGGVADILLASVQGGTYEEVGDGVDGGVERGGVRAGGHV